LSFDHTERIKFHTFKINIELINEISSKNSTNKNINLGNTIQTGHSQSINLFKYPSDNYAIVMLSIRKNAVILFSHLNGQ